MNATIVPIGRQMILATALLSFLNACQTTESASTPSTSNTELMAPPEKSAGDTAVAATGDIDILSGDEIREVLVGNTWYSEEGKEYHREDGLVRGRWQGGRDYSGKWSISGDDMHFDYAGTAYDGTFQVGIAPDGAVVFLQSGEVTHRGQVRSGNAFGL